MKLNYLPARNKGLTLIEITLVVGLLVGLATLVVFSVDSMTGWKRGRTAGEDLRSVYIAQKSYLADHPTADISTVTAAELTEYLPTGMTAIPSVTDLDDSTQAIVHTVMPPVIGSAATPYDPSPATDDGVWDVGKK